MGRLNGKQILLVVGQKNYNTEEFQYLYEIFEKEGASVFVASNRMEKAMGRLGGFTTPDLTIEEVNPEEFNALVLIGGYGARLFLWDDKKTQEMLQKFSSAGKVIAAASTAPVALANAGLLKGKKATTYPDYESSLIIELKGGKFIHENIVADDNIITSSHPKFVDELAEAIIQKVQG